MGSCLWRCWRSCSPSPPLPQPASSARSTTCCRWGRGAGRRPPACPPSAGRSPRSWPRRARTACPARGVSPVSRGACRRARTRRASTATSSLIGRQGSSGGFKVHRYIDSRGRECAFYDTALLFPGNALKLSGDSQGVAVLDMSNPRKPVQTATLTELPMDSPHESLALNPRRGLLAAVLGNPTTYPGLVSIYDAHQDCRHPKLQSTRPVARLGHESGFSRGRQDVLRHLHGDGVDLRHRRDRPQGPALDLARQHHLPRDVAERRRQRAPTSPTRTGSWWCSTPARSRRARRTRRRARSAA